MAVAVKTENKTARQDTLLVHPSDITRGRNSRIIPAADYERVVLDRAVSIAVNGQLQPAEARRDEEKRLVLTLGFTRLDAIELLRKGFDAIHPETGEPTHFHDPEARLWVKVVDCTSDEAFIRGIKENLERKDTTDLQEALAQQELRTTLGWSETRIAREYGYTNQNRVAALAKLLTLPEAVQQKVHKGEAALYTVLETLALDDPDERAAVLEGSVDERGKVNGPVLRRLIRDLLEKKAEAKDDVPVVGDDTPTDKDATPPAVESEEAAGVAKAPKRTAKDFARFVAENAENEAFDPEVHDFLNALVNWFGAKKNFGDRKLQTLLAGLKAK